MSGRIVIVSGSPGTGKTSISQKLAENSAHERAVHIHTDDFYQYIRKGYIEPWEKGSGEQNEIVIDAAVASAERFSAGGYEVFLDGTVGPWFIKPWLDIAKKGIDVRYIVLRPNEQTTVSRVLSRKQQAVFPLSHETVKAMWRSFSALGEYETHAIDTTTQTTDESAAAIKKMLSEGAFRLRGDKLT